MQGVVIGFNADKGYGFIHGEDSRDHFAHYSQIIMKGFKALKPGQKVTFTIGEGPKGEQACDIRVVEEASTTEE